MQELKDTFVVLQLAFNCSALIVEYLHRQMNDLFGLPLSSHTPVTTANSLMAMLV
jgi:hypothetical protein